VQSAPAICSLEADSSEEARVGVDLTRREHDKDVISAGVDGGDEAACASNACLLKGIVFGDLAEMCRVALLYALFYLLGVLIDYEERDAVCGDEEKDAVCGELLGNLAVHAAEAAEDVVFV
jgi:hypothetical protein